MQIQQDSNCGIFAINYNQLKHKSLLPTLAPKNPELTGLVGISVNYLKLILSD
ncbi:hypothetical protein BTURTLESOX_58 [bacterium endosymbiont of Bathymodiolus sp. 5 South]|nr:hypothetical protein BTURTLESOX_58 [bacterium endosymbiont of Bathymodiolus sp. 5 South]